MWDCDDVRPPPKASGLLPAPRTGHATTIMVFSLLLILINHNMNLVTIRSAKYEYSIIMGFPINVKFNIIVLE